MILTEVCNAVTAVSKDLPIEVVAFSAGFGGLCIHFQIFSALGDIKVNKLLFSFAEFCKDLSPHCLRI